MVPENLAGCLERLAKAAASAQRSASEITLVAVTKGVDVPDMIHAVEAGVCNLGENRVQEALRKVGAVGDYALKNNRALVWHMIGHLQTNKVREAVEIFDLIHSVDSLRLLEAIDRQAAKAGKTQEILFEVNVSGEAAKYGFDEAGVLDAVGRIRDYGHVSLRGLMTVAPAAQDPEECRPFFRRLRELRDEINRSTVPALTVLSMGMTDDVEVAVGEGATMVRIGRGIFGPGRD